VFAEKERERTNQWYADNEEPRFDSPNIDVTIEGGEKAKVPLQTFTDGSSIMRNTYFLWDNG
jgi:hypothetical protein